MSHMHGNSPQFFASRWRCMQTLPTHADVITIIPNDLWAKFPECDVIASCYQAVRQSDRSEVCEAAQESGIRNMRVWG